MTDSDKFFHSGLITSTNCFFHSLLKCFTCFSLTIDCWKYLKGYKFETIVYFEVNTEAHPSECSSIRLFRLLVHKFDSEEEVAGKSRPVNVARVSLRSRVEIVLEGIEHVLHSGVHLQ